MSLQKQLLDLDVTVNQISKGVSALVLMSQGLDQALEPCTDGFDVICGYLTDASRTLRAQTDACLSTLRQEKSAGLFC